jgi:hypothetical protein
MSVPLRNTISSILNSQSSIRPRPRLPNDRRENRDDAVALGDEVLGMIMFGDLPRSVQKTKPVMRLARFFQSDSAFRDEIRATLTSVRLFEIRTDRGGGSQQLRRKDSRTHPTRDQNVDQPNDLDRELESLLLNVSAFP